MSEAIQQAIAKILTEIPNDCALTVEERIRVADELRKSLPPESNRWTFRYALWGVCLVAILPPIILAGVSPWIQEANSQIIASIIQISSTGVGALAAYMTARRSSSGGA